MRLPPPASSPPSGICGGTAGGRALNIFYSMVLSPCLRHPGATLIDLPRLHTEEKFRGPIIARVRDPISARFWQKEYPQYDDRYRAEAAAPILNKAGQFAASPALRAILGQVSPKFDLSHAMDHRQILIANLAKGQIGEQSANLLGSLLVSHLQLVARTFVSATNTLISSRRRYALPWRQRRHALGVSGVGRRCRDSGLRIRSAAADRAD
jgi:hypothetical protein